MRTCGQGIQSSRVSLVVVNVIAMTTDLLRSAFAGEENIEMIGCASTAEELSAILSRSTPDVALVGSNGWRQNSSALSFLEQTATEAPSVRQIVIAAEMGREDIVSFFRSGARGLLCGSHANVSTLVKCIQCVSQGQIWANAEELDQLIRSLSLPRSLSVTNVEGNSILSNREEQVLQLLAEGLSNREVAQTLTLSEHTVKNHVFRIFDKLGVSNRMEAVLCAISQREQHASSFHPASISDAAHSRANSIAK